MPLSASQKEKALNASIEIAKKSVEAGSDKPQRIIRNCYNGIVKILEDIHQKPSEDSG